MMSTSNPGHTERTAIGFLAGGSADDLDDALTRSVRVPAQVACTVAGLREPILAVERILIFILIVVRAPGMRLTGHPTVERIAVVMLVVPSLAIRT
jgi:hypothetical protein